MEDDTTASAAMANDEFSLIKGVVAAPTEELCFRCADFDIRAALTWRRLDKIQILNLGPFDEPIQGTLCALCQIARQAVGYQDRHPMQTIRIKPTGIGSLMVERLNCTYYAVGFIRSTADVASSSRVLADGNKRTIERVQDGSRGGCAETPTAWYKTYEENVAVSHTLDWLATCNIMHESSCATKLVSTPDDAYFIDVKECKIVRSKLRGSEPYFALSYVCGDHRGLELTTKNLEELSKPNSLTNYPLPQTYEDAMRFTRLCHVRYLWIDFLCIMHDDESSSQRQIDAMDKIYGEAALVLIAALGSSPRFGLYPKSILPRKVQDVWLHLSRGDSGNDNFAHLEDVMAATYWTRSWCFQEQFLSTRRLYFGAHWLRFHCRGMEIMGHIDSFGGFKVEDASRVENFSPYDHSWALRTISLKAQNSVDVGFADFFRAYATTVQGFTERQLTYAQDIERAYAGIASILNRIPRNSVHAGVPTALLPHALLWYPWTKTTPSRQSSTAHFPSWSWMSAAAGVTYSPLHSGADEESEALYTLKSLVIFDPQSCKVVPSRSVLQFQAPVILASHFKLRPRQVDIMQKLGLELGDYDFSEAENADFEARGIYFTGERYNVGQVKGIVYGHESCFESEGTGEHGYLIVALTVVGLTYLGLLALQKTDVFVRVGLVSIEAKVFYACDPYLGSIRLH